MPRQLPSWIDAFDEYTAGAEVPALFRKWAGIYAVGAALERKVWLKTKKGLVFPNLFTFLVGPPGSGKTVPINMAKKFMRTLKTHKLASAQVSRASLIDELQDAERKIIRPAQDPDILSFNTLAIMLNELSVMLSQYDTEFMAVLTDLWDCHDYSESKRTHKIVRQIDNPSISILAGTTPSSLHTLLPEGAFDQGFLSRTMLIYSGSGAPGELFDHEGTVRESPLQIPMEEDFAEIGALCGPMKFTPEAAEAITDWHKRGGPPQPDHPNLSHYLTRRSYNLLKLCVIASAATTNSMTIELEHYAEALDWLLEAELALPEIFKSMNQGGDKRVIEEAYHFIYKEYMRKKEPVAEHRLINFLQEKTPAHNVQRIVEIMEKGRILEKKITSIGQPGYVPAAKRAD